jgi:hypothetical protein
VLEKVGQSSVATGIHQRHAILGKQVTLATIFDECADRVALTVCPTLVYGSLANAQNKTGSRQTREPEDNRNSLLSDAGCRGCRL